jgi:hypothetical protein
MVGVEVPTPMEKPLRAGEKGSLAMALEVQERVGGGEPIWEQGGSSSMGDGGLACPSWGGGPAREEQGREKLVRALDSRGDDLLAGGRRRGSRLEFSGRHGSELAHAMAGRWGGAPARWLLRVG